MKTTWLVVVVVMMMKTVEETVGQSDAAEVFKANARWCCLVVPFIASEDCSGVVSMIVTAHSSLFVSPC